MPHGRHIYAKASDMENARMCVYPKSENSFPHWKCVLRCCSDCPCINIPDQEISNKHDETTPTIRFHIYHIIGSCAIHGRLSLKNKSICSMCKQESSPDKSTKMMFIQVSTYQPSINWPFIYHMCAYLVQITAVNCDAQPSNDVNYFNIFYVAVIMLRWWLLAFLIKYNHNTMVEIDLCL